MDLEVTILLQIYVIVFMSYIKYVRYSIDTSKIFVFYKHYVVFVGRGFVNNNTVDIFQMKIYTRGTFQDTFYFRSRTTLIPKKF